MFDLILDKLIELALVVVELTAEGDILRAHILYFQFDAFELSSRFFLFPVQVIQN